MVKNAKKWWPRGQGLTEKGPGKLSEMKETFSWKGFRLHEVTSVKTHGTAHLLTCAFTVTMTCGGGPAPK